MKDNENNSENCAFIKILTTGNDLYGKNNCPIQFCCQLFTNEEIFDVESFFHNPKRNKVLNIIPDEEILPSGYLASGIWDQSVNGEPLKESLDKIYSILSMIRDRDIYLIGYGHMDFDIRILNEHFGRILDKEPIEFKKDHIIDIRRMSELIIPVKDIGNYTMDSVELHLTGSTSRLNEELRSVDGCVTIEKLIFERLLYKNWKVPNSVRFSTIVENLDFLERINKVLYFGKYKGLEIDEVFKIDKKYCSWLMSNKQMMETNPHMVEKINKLFNEVE